MQLEIRNIRLALPVPEKTPEDSTEFSLAIDVEIGEKGQEGAELFHFVAASPLGLEAEVARHEFKLLRGYILMRTFRWATVRRALQNVVNHANSRQSWNEVVEFFNRYGVYDSEDLNA
jgi:Immunity protein 8